MPNQRYQVIGIFKFLVILIAFEFRCLLFDCLADSEAGLAVLDGGGAGYKEGVELESHQQDRQPGAEQVQQVPPLHSHRDTHCQYLFIIYNK